MAVINQYERRVLPQGGVEAPRINAGAEFGQALAQTANAVGGLVQDIARADQIQQAKNDSAWLGNAKPQAELDLNKQIEALNDPTSGKYVDPTSDGYRGAVDKLITDYGQEAAKSAPSDIARQQFANYVTSLKVGYSGQAYQYSDEQKLAKRLADISESNQKWGAIVVTNPGRVDDAMAQQEQLIRQQIADPIKADAKVREMKATMLGFAMNGEASKNPTQFLAGIGQWGEKGADPNDIARAQNIADAEVERRRAESERKAREAEAEAKANFSIVYDDAISTAQKTGTQKTVTPQMIDQHYSGAAAEVLKRKLRVAAAEGMAQITTASTTKAEDDAWLAANAPKPGQEFGVEQAAVYKARADAIDAKRKALDAEMEATLRDSKNEFQTKVANNWKDWNQEVENTGQITDDMRATITEAYAGDPDKLKSTMDGLQQSVELGKQSRDVQTASPTADAAETARLSQAAQGGPGSADAAEQLKARTDAILKKQAAFAGPDPAGAAMATSPAVADSWSGWQDAVAANDVNAPVLMKSAIAQTLTEQERQQVPPANRKPLPDNIAAALVGQIMSLPTPKDQLAALTQYTDIGGAAGQSVLAQLTGIKGGLPNGTDVVLDIARTDRPKAERIWAGLRADTKGVTLPSEGSKAILAAGQQGLIGVLATQGDITGNYQAASSLGGSFINTAEQYAKAKVMLGTDPAEAGTAAYTDLTSSYALINDRRLAAVYYPADIEKQAPGAVEAGLAAERTRIAEGLRPAGQPNPYVEATVRDISSSGVWVNDGSGFSLVMPGSNRSIGFISYTQARDAGLAAIQKGQSYGPVNPSRPKNLSGVDTPYWMNNDVPGVNAPQGGGQ